MLKIYSDIIAKIVLSPTKTFMLDYCYNACIPRIKEKVVEMAINSSGIRDTARVLNINKNTVISILKSKEESLV